MYLLDTNVVSELRKARSGKANPGVVRWADEVDAAELFVSVITLQALEIGVLLAERKDAAKGAHLPSWLHQHVRPAISGRVLPGDTALALRSALLHVHEPRPVGDRLTPAERQSLVKGRGVSGSVDIG